MITFCAVIHLTCLQITLKNMASHPFNIYPNGLSSVLPMKHSNNGKLTQKLSKKKLIGMY